MPAPGLPTQGGSWGGPEVEELPVQSVKERGSPRLGFGGTLAVVAIVALLAAGFGVLGGRPSTEPAPTRAGFGPTARLSETPPGEPPASPRVTPWIECGEPPTTAPSIVLQVNGRPIDGAVEVLEQAVEAPPPGATTAAPTAVPAPSGERIDVPIDVISELWVAGGACAVAWTIDLTDSHVLDSVRNVARDPAYAAQNRFPLLLASHGRGDFELRAVLVFPTLVARATWPIRVLSVEEPAAILRTEGLDIHPVKGCDVTLMLATGVSLSLNPCVDDVGGPPDDATAVGPGERLEFAIDGWATDGGGVTCGRLFGESFVGQPPPGCDIGVIPRSPLVFRAPPDPGRWTLALSACGSHAASLGAGLNRICGTWYANIVVAAD